MNIEMAVVAIQSLISLSIILWLLFWALPAYRLDRYRQELFEVRDRLFDYAAAGNISFDDAAYGMLRSTINGFMRFAHRMSFCHLVFVVILSPRDLKQSGRSYGARWEKNVKALAPEVRAQLNEFLNEVNLRTGHHVLGCFADFLIWAMKSAIAATWYGGRIKRFLSGVRDNIDTTACVYGTDDIPSSAVLSAVFVAACINAPS